MKTKLKLMLALTLTFAACEKEQFVLISTETANYRFNQSNEWNKHHPELAISVTANDYTILSVADCHVGTTTNLNRFFVIAKTTPFNVIVMNGDLTLGHDYDYDAFEKCLPDRDSIPLFLIAGNHDIYFNGWEEYFARFGSSTYVFTVNTPQATDLFICLDSSGGTLGEDQMNWFEQVLLNRRKDYRHCFVITHNNMFRERHSTSTNPFVEELHTLISLFTKFHVDMVITGHDHHCADSMFGVTRYVQLDAMNDGASNAGYFKLNVKNEEVIYSFEKI